MKLVYGGRINRQCSFSPTQKVALVLKSTDNIRKGDDFEEGSTCFVGKNTLKND